MVAARGARDRPVRRRPDRFRSSSSSSALMNAAVALYIYTLVPEFLMRFMVWMLIHTVLPAARRRAWSSIPDEGRGDRWSATTCRYVDALVISAACRRPIRCVMDHRIFTRAGAQLRLPHRARDPDRAGEGGREAARGAPTRRSRASSPRASWSACFRKGQLTDATARSASSARGIMKILERSAGAGRAARALRACGAASSRAAGCARTR